MVHRKILDIAEESPNASLDEIAESIDGASVSFVRRVFEEYGDPAGPDRPSSRTDGNGHASTVELAGPDRDGSDADTSGDDSPSIDGPSATNDSTASDGSPAASNDRANADDTPITDASQLSERQRETLLAVAERPTATQAEVAEELGVSRATVSKRLNDIDGFEWADRRSYVERLFDYRGGSESGVQRPVPVGEGQSGIDDDSIADLESRLEALESRLEALESRLQTVRPTVDRVNDAELAHKVLHACIDADYVSEEEEMAIIRHVLGGHCESYSRSAD